MNTDFNPNVNLAGNELGGSANPLKQKFINSPADIYNSPADIYSTIPKDSANDPQNAKPTESQASIGDPLSSIANKGLVPSRVKNCFAPETLASAIVTCISGSMGTVMLNLPKAYATYGLAFGIIVQTYAGFNTSICALILAKLSDKYSTANLYSELVEQTLGKVSKSIFNFFFLVTVLGV
jgi:hypothetical protein